MSATNEGRKLLGLERGFWLEGRDYYERNLARSAVMALPGAGVLERAAVIASLAGAPRWREVTISDELVRELAPDVLALCYRAVGERAGAPAYVARVGSVYVRENGEWRLAYHQQTPEA